MRHNAIDKIKYEKDSWPRFIKNLKIDGIHGFNSTSLSFEYPFMVIAGENGTGKSTIKGTFLCV